MKPALKLCVWAGVDRSRTRCWSSAVLRSANWLRARPASSNSAKKTIDAPISTRARMSRSRSTLLHLLDHVPAQVGQHGGPTDPPSTPPITGVALGTMSQTTPTPPSPADIEHHSRSIRSTTFASALQGRAARPLPATRLTTMNRRSGRQLPMPARREAGPPADLLSEARAEVDGPEGAEIDAVV